MKSHNNQRMTAHSASIHQDPLLFFMQRTCRGFLKQYFLNRHVITLVGLCSLTLPAHSSNLIWQSNTFTYISGQNFRVNPSNQHTYTLEHSSSWSWGDLFTVIDSVNFDKESDSSLGSSTYYGEFSPRLSVNKLTNSNYRLGLITDLLLAATYERGENRFQNYLIGPGFDLDISGADFFQLNFYYRQADGISNKASGLWQVTPIWSFTAPIFNTHVTFDGYIDWILNSKGSVNRGDRIEKNLHFNPQLKFDLGEALGQQKKRVYIGLEYDYWSNKYGIEDGGVVSHYIVGRTKQSAISLLVKLNF
ncbi:outer membrane protein OmpK [Pseudomonas sp. Z1-14]|uniref:outer membrane protein OmpK n=1 Tax=Pseudomonas sp. Z1-14 TaxID=2817409 RepID=UPI003DAA111F